MKGAVQRLLLNSSRSALLGPRLRNLVLRAVGVPLLPDSKISRGTRLNGTRFVFAPGFGANEECWFDDHVTFGRNVRVGPRVEIFTRGHPRGGPAGRRGPADVVGPVTIGDGAWLRGRVTILPGVDVAPGCIIAIGAVVTRSTEPNGFYAGNPAIRIADLDDQGALHRLRGFA